MGKLRRGSRPSKPRKSARDGSTSILNGNTNSYSHLAMIIDSLPDSLFVVDIDGRLVWWNKKVEILSALSPAELKSKHALDFFSEKDHPLILQTLQRTFTEGQSEIEVEVMAYNGPIPFSFRAIALKDQDGRVVGLAGVGRDITAKVHAAASLRVSENRFREMLENVHLLAVILDTRGLIRFCNDYLLKVTGYTRDEILGQSWFDLFIPLNERSQFCEKFSKDMQAGILASHHEYEILSRHGNRRMISWSGTTLREADGTISGEACIGVDVTERLKSEDQLRKAREMETLGTLVSVVAHEVRSPLFVISTSAETLFKKIGDLPEVQAILDQVERLSRLMKDLLTLKPSTLPEKYPHDFLELIKVTVKHLDASHPGCGQQIQIIMPAASPKMLGDRDQLIQVFYNLLQNALQHSAPLEEPIVVQAECFGAGVLARVKDRGPGIPVENQQRVFEPFVTMRKGGVGLGLHIARRIVENHSGTIRVMNNNPGPGCCFEVFLPGPAEKIE